MSNFYDTMDCSQPGFSVHGILQARILEWVAISFSRGSSWPGDWTQVSCIAGRVFTHWGMREAVELEFALMPLSSSRSPLLPFRTFRIQSENTSCHPSLPLRLVPILRRQCTDHLGKLSIDPDHFHLVSLVPTPLQIFQWFSLFAHCIWP